MADDLLTNLSTYKSQLQQVEASLTIDSDNEDLLKLKKDLQEVIELTSELIGQKQTSGDSSPTASSSVEESEGSKAILFQEWKSGDKCLALFSEDGGYYEATIDEILEDGSCTVTFDEYGNTDVTEVSLLKSRDSTADRKRAGGKEEGPDTKKPMSKKDQLAAQREYKRKKSQKKAQKWKQLEEERESEKNKWLDFNVKTFSKTNKGKVKKSIFATPDAVQGKVGVGTCGSGGRPMTSYTHQEKWKK